MWQTTRLGKPCGVRVGRIFSVGHLDERGASTLGFGCKTLDSDTKA